MHDTLLTDDWVSRLLAYRTLFVGFSGGLDSTVLLHCLAQEPRLVQRLVAVHVHHGLSVNATAWQMHCEQCCSDRSIPLTVHPVDINLSGNVEENARVARYAVFSSLLKKNDAVLLAHHRDDQAETLLLQLFRGAGVDGMAAMPAVKKLACGELARPLLEHSRQTLEAYAKKHNLSWIDDESNQNHAFSRNYLRHQIMPWLSAKWPSVTNNLVRTATHCQEAKLNLEALAHLDDPTLTEVPDQLRLTSLKTLERPRLKNVLRVWLIHNQIRSPSEVMLNRLIDDVIFARIDASPSIQWDDRIIRRYQETLYVLKPDVTTTPLSIEWSNFPDPLPIGMVSGRQRYLHATPHSKGLKVPLGCCLEIRFRQGGESLSWCSQTKQLKKLFQQWHIPPWERDLIPLLYIDSILAAVVGYAISDHYYAKEPDLVYQVTVDSQSPHKLLHSNELNTKGK